MKLKNSTPFLMALLCLCWPLGVVFTIKSEKPTGHKWFYCTIGLLAFIGLLLPATIQPPEPPPCKDFDITASRTALAVGQSGGLSVTAKDHYYTDFTVESNNDVVIVQNNIYTAQKEGTCTLTITFENEVRTIEILVTGTDHTNEIVYASPTGQRYHRSSNHAGKNAMKFTEEEALQSGKTPCKICWK